jgi:hypothetical protein
MISVLLYLYVELAAAAALALWTLVRFPGRGPKSLSSAGAFLGAGLVLVWLAPAVVALVSGLPYGGYIALLGCVLPSYYAAFVAVGCLMRLLADALGGSGGGSGHLAPASSR